MIVSHKTNSYEEILNNKIIAWPAVKMKKQNHKLLYSDVLFKFLEETSYSDTMFKFSLFAYAFPNCKSNYYSYNLVLWSFSKTRTVESVIKFLKHNDLVDNESTLEKISNFSKSFQKMLIHRYGIKNNEISRFSYLSTKIKKYGLNEDVFQSDEIKLIEFRLATLFVLFKAFSLNKGDAVSKVSTFSSWNFSKRGTADKDNIKYFENCKSRAKEVLLDNKIKKICDKIYLGESRYYNHIFSNFFNSFKETYEELELSKSILPPDYPFELAIWDNYIHSLMLMLETSNNMEILLELITAYYLNSKNS